MEVYWKARLVHLPVSGLLVNGVKVADASMSLALPPICTGAVALWPKAIGFDVAYQEWFYELRTVVGNVNPTVNGTYHAFVHLGTFSLKFFF